MAHEYTKDSEYLGAVIGIGIPVVRSLYYDIIDRITDEKRRKQIRKKFDKLLQSYHLALKKSYLKKRLFTCTLKR